jgi:predicted ATPase with chaperone activity
MASFPRTSLTIAELAGSDTIQSEHVFEAIQYRTPDRQMCV